MKPVKPPRRYKIALFFLNAYHAFLASYLLLRFVMGSRWWWLGLLNTFALWLFMPLLVVILLALLLRGRRTTAIAGLLVLIGFIQFAPLPFRETSDMQHDIRVLTFNVWSLNPDIETAVDWILAQDADVIILQEFVGEHLAYRTRLLEDYPHEIYIEGSVRLFSRHPFYEGGTLTLVDATDEHDGRQAVRAVIEIDGQRIAVYGVHLSLPVGDVLQIPIQTPFDSVNALLRYDETLRNQQLDAIATLTQAENIPVVVAGDFNTSHTSPVLDWLRAAGLHDAFADAGAGWGMTWYHLSVDMPILRIDYIWTSGDLVPLRARHGDFLKSDHLPVIADIVFSSSD